MQTKKDVKQDVRRKRLTFFQIGLAFSIALSLVAFEWKSVLDADILLDEDWDVDTISVLKPIEIIKQTENPPEPINNTRTATNPNRIEIGEDTTYVETPDTVIVPRIDWPWGHTFAGDTEIIETEPVDVPDVMPVFPGGIDQLKIYVLSHFQMPAEAVEVGVEGKIHVMFIVDEKGRMSDVKIIRDGVGWGCAKEAERVIKQLADEVIWDPGMQNGREVKVRYRYPIVIRSK